MVSRYGDVSKPYLKSNERNFNRTDGNISETINSRNCKFSTLTDTGVVDNCWKFQFRVFFYYWIRALYELRNVRINATWKNQTSTFDPSPFKDKNANALIFISSHHTSIDCRINKKVWHLPFFPKLEQPSNENGNKSRTEWIKSRTERIEKILQTAPKNAIFKL